MRLSRKWLGREVAVMIDRPLGSAHPRYPDLTYEVNYGYIPHTRAADGEPIDAYVLGVDKPLESFSGRVAAIIKRDDDEEDKLVVCQADTAIDAAAIRRQVWFQEQYFRIRIEV